MTVKQYKQSIVPMFPEQTNLFRLFEFYLQLTYNYNEYIFITEFRTE